MKSVILCPGPSIALFDEVDFGGTVYGVNRAAILRRVDIWVCGDLPAVLEFGPSVQGNPLLVTTAGAIEGMNARLMKWRGPVFEVERLGEYLPFCGTDGFPWTFLTFLHAIVYAASRGATKIQCYGADWRGEVDADGAMAGQNRSEERWREEERRFNALVGILRDRKGVTVERITNGR